MYIQMMMNPDVSKGKFNLTPSGFCMRQNFWQIFHRCEIWFKIPKLLTNTRSSHWLLLNCHCSNHNYCWHQWHRTWHHLFQLHHNHQTVTSIISDRYGQCSASIIKGSAMQTILNNYCGIFYTNIFILILYQYFKSLKALELNERTCIILKEKLFKII